MRRFAACVFVLFAAAPAHAFLPNPHNSLDCLFCHNETPSFGTDTRDTVSFYRYERDDPALCYVCHDPEQNLHPVDVRPEESSLRITVPARFPLGATPGSEGRVVCITCHSIHAPSRRAALLRGLSGPEAGQIYTTWQGFCRQCHGDLLEKRSPHAGDERACPFCHASPPSKDEEVSILPRGVALCNFCHGALREGHTRGLNPFQGDVDCLTCHDPHLPPDRKARLKPAYFDYLRGAVTVNPHRRDHLCSLCHVEDEKFTLIVKNYTVLCNRCHATPMVVGEMHPLSEVPSTLNVPEGFPLLNGRMTCLTCHPPGHADDGPDLLRGGPYESLNAFCALCHDYSALADKDPHLPVFEQQGCEVCHIGTPSLETDTRETVSFPTSVNLLCLRCHEDFPHPGGRPHTVFPGEDRARAISENLPLSRYRRITCATCHNPHFPASVKNKLRHTTAEGSICMGCHAL